MYKSDVGNLPALKSLVRLKMVLFGEIPELNDSLIFVYFPFPIYKVLLQKQSYVLYNGIKTIF